MTAPAPGSTAAVTSTGAPSVVQARGIALGVGAGGGSVDWIRLASEVGEGDATAIGEPDGAGWHAPRRAASSIPPRRGCTGRRLGWPIDPVDARSIGSVGTAAGRDRVQPRACR